MKPHPPRHLPDEQPASSRFSDFAIALGLVAGLLLGLAISWARGPLPESHTAPHQLREDARRHYMAAIALEYQYAGDLRAALEKLVATRPRIDPLQALADAACQLSQGDYLESESGRRALRAMTDLARSQGRSSCAEERLPAAAPILRDAPAPAESVKLPSATPPPTKTPPRPVQPPTATLRVAATALPQRRFTPRPASSFCDLDNPAMIEVYVVDYLGRGLPGQRIRLRFGDEANILVSGLKVDRGDAYADFQMQAGLGYIIDMPGVADALGAELRATPCFTASGRESLKSYRVTFVEA